MQPTMSLLTILAATVGTASAQYAASTPSIATTGAASASYAASSASITTITVKPGCPTAAPADVMVTRADVVVPSCAGNSTKPTLITMPGYGTNANATSSGQTPVFTGAAGRVDAAGAVAVLAGGVFVAMLI